MDPVTEISNEEIDEQVELLCRHPLLAGEYRPHLLRFLVNQKRRGRFIAPFTAGEPKPKPTGTRIVFEFYKEQTVSVGRKAPDFGTYDDAKGRRLITGLIEAIREFYEGRSGPKDKGAIRIEVPGGRGKAYEPSFSHLQRYVAQPSPQEEKGVAGRYQYIVYRSDNTLSHCGKCRILEVDERLVINGERQFCLADAQTKTVRRVRSFWRTDWCEICVDGVFRFVYHIDVQGERASTVKGFCQMELGEQEMAGKYHLLPPFDEDETNAKTGTIVLTRLGPNAEVGVPTGYTLR